MIPASPKAAARINQFANLRANIIKNIGKTEIAMDDAPRATLGQAANVSSTRGQTIDKARTDFGR